MLFQPGFSLLLIIEFYSTIYFLPLLLLPNTYVLVPAILFLGLSMVPWQIQHGIDYQRPNYLLGQVFLEHQ